MFNKMRLLNTDLELSNICLGCGQFGGKRSKEEAFKIMDAYVGKGGNFLDTANVYCRWIPGKDNCSELIIGEWLKSRKAYHQVIVATKGGHYDLDNPMKSRINKVEIGKDLDESLQTLGTNCIDFYWLHRDDETKPIEEIVEMMEQLVKEGKIRYYGASNYRKERMEAASEYAKKHQYQGFSGISNRWSLATVNVNADVKQEDSMVAMTSAYYHWHRESQMPIMPYAATASGFFEKLFKTNPLIKNGELIGLLEKSKLSDELQRKYLNKENLMVYELLMEIKKERSLHALSIAYLLNQPFPVFPVCGFSREEQLQGLDEASQAIVDSKIINQINELLKI